MLSQDSDSILFDAIAFAARAHRHQIRKDNLTPYVSHVFRVAMVTRHVFGIADPKLIAAAVLHDTIEDTTTDYDDVASRFGADVAAVVVALTKDMRLPVDEREAAYAHQLAAGGWRVSVCKLADIYDNLADCKFLDVPHQRRTLSRSTFYLEALRPGLTRESAAAFDIVQNRVLDLEKLLANA